MAPKRQQKKIPGDSAPALKLRKALGGTVTPENVMQADHVVRQKAFGAVGYFAKQNPIHPLAKEWSDAKGTEQKRAVMCKYVMEAGEGKLVARNVHSVEETKQEDAAGRWLYKSQIRDILKDDKLTDLVVSELTPMESDCAAANAAGYKLYWYSEKVWLSSIMRKKKAEVENSCDVDRNTFHAVSAAIDAELTSGSANVVLTRPAPGGKRWKAVAKVEQTETAENNSNPDQAKIEAELAECDKIFNAARKLIVKMSMELRKCSLVIMHLNTKKPWGPKVAKNIDEGSNVQKTALADLQRKLSECQFNMDNHGVIENSTTEQWSIAARELDTFRINTESAYKSFVKNVLGDFIKYCGK